MSGQLLEGYAPPFSCRRTHVYNVIEDSEGKLLCFKSIDECMNKNTVKITEILNAACGIAIAKHEGEK